MEGHSFAVGRYLVSPLYGSAGLVSHVFWKLLIEEGGPQMELCAYACMEQEVAVVEA